MDQRWASQHSTTAQQGYHEDLPMEDADLDPYNKQKYEDVAQDYSSAQHVRQQLHVQPIAAYEESSAARRYSPMKLSPTTQDGAQAPYGSYTPTLPNARHSPSRPAMLTSDSYSHYQSPSLLSYSAIFASATYTHVIIGSRPPMNQLSPLQGSTSPNPNYYPPRSATLHLNEVYGHDDPSPTRLQQQQTPLPRNTQPPKFTKCMNVADLQPQLRTQPPFRRANPEGGFISVRDFQTATILMLTSVISRYKHLLRTSRRHIVSVTPTSSTNRRVTHVESLQNQARVAKMMVTTTKTAIISFTSTIFLALKIQVTSEC